MFSVQKWFICMSSSISHLWSWNFAAPYLWSQKASFKFQLIYMYVTNIMWFALPL